jgi:hypothetical protein
VGECFLKDRVPPDEPDSCCVSGVKVGGGGGGGRGGPGITVFEDVGFDGGSETFNADVPNLVAEGWNDVISSFRIRGGGDWEVCEDVNYRGRCLVVSGDNANLVPSGWNDRISSIRRARAGGGGGGGGGAGVTIFEHVDYDGGSETFNADVPNLVSEGWNDVISSFRIRGGAWEMCEDVNYRGRCRTFASDTPNLVPLGWNDRISSMRKVRAGGGGGETIPAGATNNTERPGNDIRDFDLAGPNPATCQAECAGDGRCRAWTYVRPGYQGPSARCYLKRSVPAPVSNACCISGVGALPPPPPVIPGGIDNSRRSGGEYSNFRSNIGPSECKDECEGDSRCVDWTYVKPGFEGRRGRCYLHRAGSIQRPDACCVSSDNRGGREVIGPNMRDGFDRPGFDMRPPFRLARPSPELCQAACFAEFGCRAWTYSRPRTRDARPLCYLKSIPGPKVADPCCIIGKKPSLF